VWKLLNDIALAPPPSLHPLRPGSAPVCLGTSLALRGGPTAWVRPSSAYGHSLPDTIGAGLLHRCGLLHGRCTQALPIGSTRCFCACSGLRPCRVLPPLAKGGWLLLPSMRPYHVGTRKLYAYFGAQCWVCTSPVNASRTALLSFAHDSEPEWLAGPSLLRICTPSIVPVLIGAPQRSAFSRRLEWITLIDRESIFIVFKCQKGPDPAKRLDRIQRCVLLCNKAGPWLPYASSYSTCPPTPSPGSSCCIGDVKATYAARSSATAVHSSLMPRQSGMCCRMASSPQVSPR
jgi:hypothetical protein